MPVSQPNASGGMGPWHTVGDTGEPAFLNSWVNFGGSNQPAQFRVSSSGIVYMRGLVKNGTINTPMFTLPALYRPPFPVRVIIQSNGTWAFGYVDVDGSVYCSAGSNGSVDITPLTYFVVGAA